MQISVTEYAERTIQQIEPIRNIFAALFLASIGLIMNPLFLWTHIDILFASLLVVVVAKVTLTTVVVRAFGYSPRVAFTVGVCLAQVRFPQLCSTFVSRKLFECYMLAANSIYVCGRISLKQAIERFVLISATLD